MYSNLIIYYFSGTGNALAAANWISEVAIGNNITTKIIRITPSLKISEDEIPNNTLIGFCYPTHGFNAPPVIIDLLLRFPKMRNQVFLLNTRAGMKLHKIFTPGLSGLAQLFPALILRLKGFQIIGFQPMDLPSNWISVHPGLKDKVVDSIFKRCEQITKIFAEKIISGKKVHRGLISLPIDLLVSPISIVYYFYGRFTLAKTFIADSKCNSCGLCAKECPVGAIKMKNARPFWTWKCESCMHCMNVCPQKAIQTPHSFILLLWWLVFSIIPILLTKLIASPESYVEQHFELFADIFGAITALPLIFFGYRILHFSMRFRFFSWLVEFTSLTRFQFWRRYKAPK